MRVFEEWHIRMFCAILPSSLHALHFTGKGRVSLPDLKRLTALTELRLNYAVLTPRGGQLPPLPALRVLSLVGTKYSPWVTMQRWFPGPQELGLAHSKPHLAEVRFAVGEYGMSAPHEQLALLALLAQLRPIELNFTFYRCSPTEGLLRPETLLSLPPSVTKLVLRDVDRCVPAVALPENIAIVRHEEYF